MKKFLIRFVGIVIVCGMLAGLGYSLFLQYNARFHPVPKVGVDAMLDALTKTSSESCKLGTFQKTEDNIKSYYTADLIEASSNQDVGVVIVSEQNGTMEDIMIQSRVATYAQDYANTMMKTLGVTAENITAVQTKIIQSAEMDVFHSLDADGYRIAGWLMKDTNTQKDVFKFLIKHKANVGTYAAGQFSTTKLSGTSPT